MAAPVVSGTAALMLGKSSSLTAWGLDFRLT